jgi:hypothetical protein
MVEYKVVELMIVTDEFLEETLNTWTQQGWIFDSLHFAMSAGSKRPAMAFLFFVHSLETTEEAAEEKGEKL